PSLLAKAADAAGPAGALAFRKVSGRHCNHLVSATIRGPAIGARGSPCVCEWTGCFDIAGVAAPFSAERLRGLPDAARPPSRARSVGCSRGGAGLVAGRT